MSVLHYPWYEVLDMDPATATPATIESAYKREAARCDTSQALWLAQIVRARKEALEAIRA